MEKKIFYSHGDKGGCGKSVAAALMVDALLGQGLKVGLIEGDASMPDVATRYVGLVDWKAANLNKAGASTDAVLDFGHAVSELVACDAIVVNTPAAAGDTLDGLAAAIVGASRQIGFDSVVAYSLSHTVEATRAAEKSLAEGLLGAVPEENRHILIPRFLGRPEKFNAVQTGALADWAVAGVHDIPEIDSPGLAQKVLGLTGTFSGLIAGGDGELDFFERMVLGQRWVVPSLRVIERIVGQKQDQEGEGD